MTRLYISADLEGVLGVTSPHQCFPGADKSGYNVAVNQLALELKTVIDIAFKAGVKEVLVNDSHAYMVNFSPSHLLSNVQLLSGKPKACAMSAGLDSSFDAAFYIGYHAMAGTRNGVICHTFHDHVFEVTVNGLAVGEGGFNALYASLVYQVPVMLVSGDAAVCSEMCALLPAINTVTTKTGLGFSSALSRSWEALAQDYQQTVAACLMPDNLNQAKQQLLSLNAPFIMQVTLLTTHDADVACTMPWLTRLDGRRVELISDSFETLYRALQSIYAILAYPAFPKA